MLIAMSDRPIKAKPVPRRQNGPGRPFKPGQSGNPAGRPREYGHVRKLARENTDESINTLVAIMRDEDQPAAARVRACEAILDRGWGRPTQPISGEDGGPIETRNLRELSDEELLALALGARAVSPE